MAEHEPAISSKRPAECSREEMDCFRALVLEAGEVEETGLDDRIARAETLALLKVAGTIVGVGALKIPSDEYARKLFRRANSKDNAGKFRFELGWVVVEKSYRRRSFSRRIVDALVAQAKGQRIYATSVSTRIPMHKALVGCGFERDGEEWRSLRRPNEALLLFVHRSA